MKINVSFRLKDKNNQSSLIYMFVSYAGKSAKISTKQNVPVKYWDSDKYAVKSKYEPSSNINRELDEQKNQVIEIFNRIVKDRDALPTPKELQDVFKSEYFDNSPVYTKEEKKTLLTAFDVYIKTMVAEGKTISANKYKVIENRLKEFATAYRYRLDFDQITEEFRADYLLYLSQVLKFKQTTIFREMKFIKTIIKFAIDNGYMDQSNINLAKFVPKDGESQNIALTPEELEEIEQLDLSNDPKLDRVRDRFLIGCYTGARFSDFIRLSKEHIQVIDGEQYIVFEQEKTDAPVTLPFWDNIRKIFEKYDYNMPRAITNQKFNEYLREVCLKCELLRKKMEVSDTEKGKKVKQMIPRYELVHTHTARRTFATIANLKGIDLDTIRMATGHASVKQLETYIKVTNIQKAQILKDKFAAAKQKENDKQTAKVYSMAK